jgi:hypothetical protein
MNKQQAEAALAPVIDGAGRANSWGVKVSQRLFDLEDDTAIEFAFTYELDNAFKARLSDRLGLTDADLPYSALEVAADVGAANLLGQAGKSWTTYWRRSTAGRPPTCPTTAGREAPARCRLGRDPPPSLGSDWMRVGPLRQKE